MAKVTELQSDRSRSCAWTKPALRNALADSDRFVVVAGVVTRRGPITDHPGGNATLSPEKQCIWALACERPKAYGQEESMLDWPVVTNDNEPQGTSAWASACLGSDNRGRSEHGESQR